MSKFDICTYSKDPESNVKAITGISRTQAQQKKHYPCRSRSWLSVTFQREEKDWFRKLTPLINFK